MTSGREAGQALLQVLADGTAALAHLDAESLELLERRVAQIEGGLRSASSGPDQAQRLELQTRRRVFAEVVRTTGEQLDLLKRLHGRGGMRPWDH